MWEMLKVSEYILVWLYVYRAYQMFGNTIFKYFQWSLLCLPRLHLFDEKYSKNSNIVKYYYNLI